MIAVGTLEPRKNILKLIQAYELIKKEKVDFHLLIVGKSGIAEPVLKEYVKEKQLEAFVHFLGYVEDKDLTCLYNGALGFAAVSLYEGFGLPALEAMSSGISGISSNRTSLPEVVGNAALLVDPENVSEIADAIKRFSSDGRLRESLSRKAYERSKLFSTREMANKMINIFKETCV